MISGIQLSFFSNYIYNPKTWFHSIPVKYKILFVSIYLIIIPYLPLSIFSSITIIISCFFMFLAYSNESVYLHNILLQLIIYCTLLLFMTTISPISTRYTITIPYHIKIQWLEKNRQVVHVLHYCNVITVLISKLITRMLLLLTSYYLGYQLLMLTTQMEDIFINHLYVLHALSKDLLISFIPDFIFIIILSYEYISLIENTIQNVVTSLTLRGQSWNMLKNYTELLQIFSLLLSLAHNHLNQEIITTNNIIHSRELYMSSKEKWLINLDQ